jgi:hypothetical protein
MLVPQVWGTFDGHPSDDDVVCLFDVRRSEPQVPQEGETRLGHDLSVDAEPVVGLLAEHPRCEREREVEHSRDRFLDLVEVFVREPRRLERRTVHVRGAEEGVRPRGVGNDFLNLRLRVTELA